MLEIIPNWHPILVHFTIGLLAMATVLFVVVALRGRAAGGVETAANWNLWLGVLLTLLTVAAGLQASGTVAHDDAAHVAMQNHKFWAFGTTALFAALALWNLRRVRGGRPVSGWFAAALVVAAVGLAGTGLRGADLVFRHGLGVMSLPEAGGEGHSHEDGAGHDHEDDTGHQPPAAAAAPPPEPELTPAEAEVVAALVAYHDALTSGDATAPEPFVLADERFLMIEGRHVNRGWADYRDNHLRGELADLAKIRFRLSGYRVQMDGGLASVSFLFNILPRTGPEMDFGSGRASAVLVRSEGGWKVQLLHTS